MIVLFAVVAAAAVEITIYTGHYSFGRRCMRRDRMTNRRRRGVQPGYSYCILHTAYSSAAAAAVVEVTIYYPSFQRKTTPKVNP